MILVWIQVMSIGVGVMFFCTFSVWGAMSEGVVNSLEMPDDKNLKHY
jgi:hypothetical protein